MSPTHWIFGYGSLIWRAEFAFDERRAGYIEGWARRFWQGSTDHRGLPDKPGRVVTLVAEPGARCWGVAYRIAEAHAERVLCELDHRERGGYRRHEVALHLSGEPSVTQALVYVAAPDNPNYLGPAPLTEIARQILAAHGPSGPNPEYVLRLAESLAALSASDDEHVHALAELVRSGLVR